MLRSGEVFVIAVIINIPAAHDWMERRITERAYFLSIPGTKMFINLYPTLMRLRGVAE